MNDRAIIHYIESRLNEPPREFSRNCECGHKEEDHRKVPDFKDEVLLTPCRICICEGFEERTYNREDE